MIEKGARTPVEKPGPSETLRDPQRDLETSRDTWRHLETPRHTWGDHQPEKHTLLIMFFFCFLYMFTEWTKFNKLNMILQPFIPTLKVPFFWSMFSLLKRLKTRKEKLSTSWLKSELTFMFGAQFTGCCGSWSAACRAESLHHHMEAPHQ